MIIMYYPLPAYKVCAYQDHRLKCRRHITSIDVEIENGMLDADAAYNMRLAEA